MCKSPPPRASKPQPPPKLEPAATPAHGLSPTLLPAVADYDHSSFLAWFFVILCTTSFLLGPLILLSPLVVYPYHPKAAGTLLCLAVFLACHPVAPWPRFRRVCQLFYRVFDCRHNVLPESNAIEKKENRLSIFAQHPHAIIPLQGYFWVALCDQLLPDMYGYGCTTDGALVLPILRHMLLWFGSGSATKKRILTEMRKHDKNIYILPGGVAEIFLSRRRSHPDDLTKPNTQTIKGRRYGLMKLALQTGAALRPSFVFGVSDALAPIAPAPADDDDGASNGKRRTVRDAVGIVMERLSRRVGGGLAPFYGQYGLPVPHAERMTMVLGDPVLPVLDGETTEHVPGGKVACRRVEDPTDEQVEELMGRYVDALHRLFEQYKAEAGYPNETLVIV